MVPVYTMAILFLLSCPYVLFAQEYNTLVNLPLGEADDGFSGYVNALFVLAISVAALIAVIKIIIAGVKYMLSDVVTSKESAKRDIKAALLGLILILAAVLILETINPQLTNFTFNFKRPPAPPVTQSENTPSPEAGATGDLASAAAAEQSERISGGCNQITREQTSVVDSSTGTTIELEITTLDFSGCTTGDPAPALGAFSRECMSKRGQLRHHTSNRASCAVAVNGSVVTNYGTVVQTKDSYVVNINFFNKIDIIVEETNKCEDKWGRAEVTDTTLTCNLPTVLSYSGDNADYGQSDCSAKGGTYDSNWFTPDYCIIWN